MNAKLILATTFVVASAVSAYADGVDGVLITQASAEAGNVTPGDAPGFPVTLSQPGLYKLASTLTVPTGTSNVTMIGIQPTVDDVTIDLNGYRLHAFGGVHTTGIRSNRADITIRNGTIAGFSNVGIRAEGSNWIIEAMRIAGNSHGILAETSNRTVVRNSQVVSNGSGGSTSGNGVGISCGASCLIAGNIVASNKGDGIVLASGLITGNAILFNGGTGIANAGGATNDVGSNGNVVFGNTPNLGTGPGSFDQNWCGAEC